MKSVLSYSGLSACLIAVTFCMTGPVFADQITSTHALRIVNQYKGTFASAPSVISTDQTTDAPLLGNGDVGVAVLSGISSMTFVIDKNEFWSLNDKGVRTMAKMSLSVPSMAGASYSMTEDIALGEVNGTFGLNGATITTKTWVQADNTVINRLITKFTYTGSGTRSVAVSFAPGDGNSYPNSTGSSGDVLSIDVRADNVDNVGGYAAHKARLAARVIGAAGTVTGNTLNFTLTSGQTVSLVTCIMSNYDSAGYQAAAISGVSAATVGDIDSYLSTHHAWWNNFYGASFIEIPDKAIEKEYYASLYLLASSARTNEAAPGLFGNWALKNPAWNGDYTLNYNYEAPFYLAFPTNHAELADCYDKPVIDWAANGQALAAANGWTGAYYRVHIGPLPGGSADTNQWNQKSCGAFAATDMLMHYYYTRDLTYANKVYPALKQVATFWQNYLSWDGTRYVILNDAQHEGNAYPQTNGVMSLGLVRFLLQGCIDLSADLNQDASLRATWQDRLGKLSAFPTFTRNGQTVFRYTEIGLDWNSGNAIGIQHIYPGSQIGLGSDSTLLQIAKNMVGQMARWSDDNGTNTFYPAAARVGYDPATILTQLDSWIAGHTYPNLHIHTGGGGLENFNTVPSTVCEMLAQSFQNKIRLFSDWPANTYAKFGDLAAYGGFLVSSDIEKNAVQYVRIVSNKGRNCTFVNPWPGQTLRVYRNGIDSGTVSGGEITLVTAVNETIHVAPDGTSYNEILARMSLPAGAATGMAFGPYRAQCKGSFSITKEGMPARTIVFSTVDNGDDAKRLVAGIYRLNGSLIKMVSANGNSVRWNLTDAANARVPAGAYVWKVKIELKGRSFIKSGTLLIER
ncbi:MAG TPA: hypothetical protein VLX68_08200 [Chitinivibrionales bacterium]|nr:hypothetical protein [Chitinivibrionales bacterium]